MKRCIAYLFIIPILIGIHSSLLSQNAPVVVNYSYEPAVQHFNILPGVNTITVTIVGAQGGGALGGKGASFAGICNVISPHVLSVVVGQEGIAVADTGNFNGGGGGGGGASWVYDSNIVLYHPIGTIGLLAVAGGGDKELLTTNPFKILLQWCSIPFMPVSLQVLTL
jgi:Glycine rich protein